MNQALVGYSVLLLLLLHTAGLTVLAQEVNLGIPPLWNFPKKVYQAGTQNWDAAQDRRGVLYWANNDGLLQYDGTHWRCSPVANHTIVRSVAVDSSGRIFVGAQSELGYFYAGPNGVLTYHSLVDLLPGGQRNFEDVWDIVFWQGDVFFRTNRVVFQYSGSALRIHEPGGALNALFVTPAGLMLHRQTSDLLLLQNGAFMPFLQPPELQSVVTGASPWLGDTVLLTTLKNGIFYLEGTHFGRWSTPYDRLLTKNRVYSAAALPGNKLALGTSLDGLVVLDQQRRVSRHLTKKNGLQNNNILHALCDQDGNIWLGLDNGIDCVVQASPFTAIIPDGDLQGAGYAAAVHEGYLYLGVSNGVYRAPWQSVYDPEKGPFFQKVPGTEGQVWSLNVFDDVLLMGHHEGAFQIANGRAVRLSPDAGAWTFVPLTQGYLLGGTYNGVVLYKKNGRRWEYDRQLPGLRESCRIMVKDADGSVWVSHPYRGVYHVRWSPERPHDLNVQFYNAAQGLPADLNNYVFQVAGRAFFATEKGVYRFDTASGRFLQDEIFARLLGNDRRIKCLREDARGNVWYEKDQEVGVLLVDEIGLRKEVGIKAYPELGGKLLGGFEFIYPINVENVLFGTEQGFIHLNAAPDAYQQRPPRVLISRVNAGGMRDSLLYDGFIPAGGMEPPVLESGMNNLVFSFSATDFQNPGLIQYRVRLDGLDPDWSDWSSETWRNYTNLGPGKYVFLVQVRRQNGPESNAESFAFTIRPPWYKSSLALFLYVLALVLAFFGFLFRQRKKFEDEKAQLAVTHQQKEAQHIRTVEQTRAALAEMQNEKLETEIQFKNQELALTTMHLVQKGEILLTIQETLRHILEKSTNPALKKEIQQMLNLLNFDVKLDEDWEHFAFYFDQVHVDFLKRLREQYPQLSPNDHRLCAYLRMNLSTKEIAPLMNISVRGVEGSRYRLRKKLNLPNDANLTEFLNNIGGASGEK